MAISDFWHIISTLIQRATPHRHNPARRSTGLHEYFIHRNLKRFGSCPDSLRSSLGNVLDAKAPIVTDGKPGIVRPRMSAGPRIEAMRKNERMQLFDLLRDLLRKRSPDNTQKGRREEQ
ncbi:hypothetical protein [Sinorhizobium meliloti]|uniref:hypothetical protein n=1 Tax=Rhizobium meliloti TaxID=382 RepID=UPI00398D2FB1